MTARGPALPDLDGTNGVKVRSELVGEKLRYVVEVDGGCSTRETIGAVRRVRAKLAGVPEEMRRLDVRLGRHSLETIDAAKTKRARRAERRRGAP